MDVSMLPALPALIAASAVGMGVVVFGLLLLLQDPIAAIPGFRPDDGTRDAFLRITLFALTLAGLVALAWTQSIVIARAEWPALLAAALAAAGVGHFTYQGKQLIAKKTAAPTVPPVPANATTVG